MTKNSLVLIRLVTWGVVGGILVSEILGKLSGPSVWDDAFMFTRYADNAINSGTVSWNPGEKAVYGLTSQLYLLPIIGMRLLFPHDPVSALVWASVLCGLLFFLWLVVLTEKMVKASPPARQLAVCVVQLTMLTGARSFTEHCVSGMDTTFAILYLSIYIFLAIRLWNTSSRRKALFFGAFGGLAYFARPELMVFTVLIPLMVILLEQSVVVRKNASLALVTTIIVAIMEQTCAFMYFGSPVPLSFFAKCSNLYGDTISNVYKFHAAIELKNFVLDIWPILLVSGIYLVCTSPLIRMCRLGPLEAGLASGVLLVILYYRFFVIQIMPYDSRFYYPTVPALAYLGAVGMAQLTEVVAKGESKTYSVILRMGSIAGTVLVICVGLFMFQSSVRATVAKAENGVLRLRPVTAAEGYRIGWRHWWAHLDAFSALPDSLVIATTEVGRVAALNPQKKIVDLAGLNNTHIAFNGLSSAWLFGEHNPDLIYLPHPHYEHFLSEILSSPYFRSRYDYYGPEKVKAAMGVGLRKDSPHYRLLRNIVRNDPKNGDR